jgi:isopentenyl-diphosphate delta-isomerase
VCTTQTPRSTSLSPATCSIRPARFSSHDAPCRRGPGRASGRALFELGLSIANLTVTLPDFRYRAVDSSGIVENEICPVYLARATGEPVPNPDEVMEFAWVEPAALQRSVRDAPWAFSPWLGLQLQELTSFDA